MFALLELDFHKWRGRLLSATLPDVIPLKQTSLPGQALRGSPSDSKKVKMGCGTRLCQAKPQPHLRILMIITIMTDDNNDDGDDDVDVDGDDGYDGDDDEQVSSGQAKPRLLLWTNPLQL